MPAVTDDTPSRTPSRWNGLTTEERQRERRRLLIDAAFELLGTEGASGTTVRAVCSTARLNPRYFYESFDDLDQLIVAVYDRTVRGLGAAVFETVASTRDEDEALRAVVSATVRYIDEDRRRGRIMYIEGLGNEALNIRRTQAGIGLLEQVQQEPAGWRGGATGIEVGKLGAAVVVGGFAELLVAWLDGRIQMSADELIDHTTRMFLAIRDVMRSLEASPAG